MNRNNNGVGSSSTGGSSQLDNSHVQQQDGSPNSKRVIKKPQQTIGERRELRKKYRTLIQDVSGNKSELISPSSDGLLRSLKKADNLYNNVHQAREAVLDSELLALTSQFGVEQAQKFKVSLNAYDSYGLVSRFKERLTYYSDENNNNNSTINQIGWEKLSELYHSHFHTVPVFDFMYGPINFEPEEKKVRPPRKQNQKDVPVGAAKHAEKIVDTTTQVESETTSSRVQVMKQYLEKNPGKSFIDLVADDTSFAQTVENIFYFSFLLKDGHVKIAKDNEDMIIQPTQPPEEKDYQSKNAQLTHSVVKLDYNTWNNLKEISDLSFHMEEELQQFKKRRGGGGTTQTSTRK
ncbi:hypothetical protein RB653_006163 [Dictyostelium firmibasis]|uniref:Non-structural maintenance of chromosomes element 4 n=1 Tax=Dictyostelium firmibasis TaxID=79012 RepID=A0AAN7UDZ5_9MYCE